MRSRTLRESDFDAVLAAFNRAFSDYIVPLILGREQLQNLMARRGYAPEASAAFFDGDEISAFVLNGRDGAAAYNMGTGTVPEFRRRGLSRELLKLTIPLLHDHGARSYLLEVIETNTPAVRLYEDLGFVETRRLQCWTLATEERDEPIGALLREMKWEEWSGWWEARPSWQNSRSSVERSVEPFLCIGDERGYAIVFPQSADLAQLAVAPEQRRRGLGRRLLHSACALAERPLRILNVDERAAGIARFLRGAGAIPSVRQIEMLRNL